MNFLKFVLASAVLVAATPAFANTVTLDCTMTDLKKSGGWIPSKALIKVDTARKSVQLLKPTARQMNGKIKSAKLVRNGSKKMVLRWILTGTKSSSNQTTTSFNFRALVEKETGKVSVIAKPLGYSNDWRAKGLCKIS